LDFQSVMTQFLELQRHVIGAFGVRSPRVRLRERDATAVSPIETPVIPDAAAASTAAVEVLPVAWEPREQGHSVFSRYTLTARSHPLGRERAGLAPGHA